MAASDCGDGKPPKHAPINPLPFWRDQSNHPLGPTKQICCRLYSYQHYPKRVLFPRGELEHGLESQLGMAPMSSPARGSSVFPINITLAFLTAVGAGTVAALRMDTGRALTAGSAASQNGGIGDRTADFMVAMGNFMHRLPTWGELLPTVRGLLRPTAMSIYSKTKNAFGLIAKHARGASATWSQEIEASVTRALSHIETTKSETRAVVVEKRRDASFSSVSDEQVRDNIVTIDQVLDYWFGQGPDTSQKKLWMIASQKEAWRNTIDAEITDRFGHLVCKPPTKWWTDTELYSYRGKVAAIIVLDQFSRHVHRHWSATSNARPIPAQSDLDHLAYQVAEKLLDNPHAYAALPIPMLIFTLLPFRHRSTIPSLQWTQEQTNVVAGLHTQYDEMIRSFRKATNRRLAVLQDEDRRGGPTSSTDLSDEAILECGAFEADLSKASQHVVYKTIGSFLQQQALTKQQVLISLSGGVDSMVILSVLALLIPTEVAAVHIDYANRPESVAEAEFLRKYCQELKVAFHCRRIDEVTRGVTARDDYERLARTIRYDTYRLHSPPNAPPRVMLGHHRGDLRENVLSNAHKGSGPLDLSGMTSVSWNEGVQLLRPLLPLEKTAIFDYAHTFGIPYFKDTTPHWSTRGKLRNKLLPLLQEIYGDGSMNNLSKLAAESDCIRDLFSTSFMAPFLKELKKDRMGISFETRPWKDLGLFFWKFVLKEVLHSVGLGMFSDKSAATFHERVCKPASVRPSWLQCRKDYAVYVNADGRVYVLYPDSFPWTKATAYQLPSEPVELDETTIVGPWSISYACLGSSPEVARSLLEEKAVPSMDHFLKGEIQYHMTVPLLESEDGSLHVKPLVFDKFQKENRPLAWKQGDIKIQETLPLLCNDGVAKELLSYETCSKGIVKVTLERSTDCISGYKSRNSEPYVS